MRRVLPPAALLLLVSCTPDTASWTSPPVVTPLEPEIILESAARTWSGGAVQFRSDSFATESVTVLLDGAPANARRLGPVRFSLQLPDSAGRHAVAVVFPDSDTVAVAEIEAVGTLQRWFDLDFSLAEEQSWAWPDPYGARVVVDAAYIGLVSVDLRTPHTWDTLAAVGYDPVATGNWLTFARSGWVVACSRDDPLVAVDSTPSPPGGYRTTYLGGSRWIWYTRMGYRFQGRTPDTWFVPLHDWWAGWEVLVSPDGARAVPRTGGTTTEADSNLVFWDTATLAEHVVPLQAGQGAWVHGTNFSPNGDTVYVVAGSNPGPVHFFSFAASDGHRLVTGDTLPLPGYTFEDLVVDPSGPWLYVIGDKTASGPVVYVLNRGPMTVAGRLTARAGGTSPYGTGNAMYWRAFVDGPGRRLFVRMARVNGPDRVFEYDLLR